MSKFELLAKEYQNQNKSQSEKNANIISSEKIKRQEIIENFEKHLSQIKAQIKSEQEKSEKENSMAKEN